MQSRCRAWQAMGLHVPLKLTSPVQAAAALHANDAQIGRLQHAARLESDEEHRTMLEEAR